eukprot:jgi/Botrbrau1/1072/Bobra.0076s0037.1
MCSKKHEVRKAVTGCGGTWKTLNQQCSSCKDPRSCSFILFPIDLPKKSRFFPLFPFLLQDSNLAENGVRRSLWRKTVHDAGLSKLEVGPCAETRQSGGMDEDAAICEVQSQAGLRSGARLAGCVLFRQPRDIPSGADARP